MNGSVLEVIYVAFAILLVMIIFRRVAAMERRITALTRIEAKVDLLMSRAGINFDPYENVPSGVAESLRAGHKVNAIKRYREASGATLKEAIGFVEEIQRKIRPWDRLTPHQDRAMNHEKINYIEFPANDIAATKAFFESAFGWSFVDYGPAYAAFSNEGLDGGFFKSELKSVSANGAALLIFYSSNLESTQAKVEAAGGVIVKPIFSFPGGRRFHFTEPSGNELAVWSDN